MTDHSRRNFVRASGALAAIGTLGPASRAGAQGTQPLDSVPWNPRGYCNNLCHRVRAHIG